MFIIKKAVIGVAAVLVVCLACGCTVSNGVFTGMSQRSSDTSLSASYASFDGSLARSVLLNEGDEVCFRYEGGGSLQAIVRKDGETLCEIADGTTFTALADGRYAFAVEGEAKDGAFTLSWIIE